jgi:hypothetical protein
MTDEMTSDILAVLKNMHQELKTIRQLTSQYVNAMVHAEDEIPENMRRFMNYMHDVHDVRYMYESLGHTIPPHINREMERLDDRYRQLIYREHTDGGAFEKIRREMAADPLNRWDHTRFLDKPKENGSETGKSE